MGSRTLPLVSLLAAVGCGARSELPRGSDDGAACDPTKPFGPPVPVEGVSPAFISGSLSPDELTIYGEDQGYHLQVAKRSKRTSPFGAAASLTTVNVALSVAPSISSDELTLVFEAMENPCGPWDTCFRIHWASRESTSDNFSPRGPVPVINDRAATVSASTFEPFLGADGQTLYFAWNGGPPVTGTLTITHIWRSRRAGSTWAEPERVRELYQSYGENAPVLSADNLSIYFAVGPGAGAVWVATRPHETDSFGSPNPVPGLERRTPEWLSPDGCRLYTHRFPTTWSDTGVFEVSSRPR